MALYPQNVDQQLVFFLLQSYNIKTVSPNFLEKTCEKSLPMSVQKLLLQFWKREQFRKRVDDMSGG